MPPKVGDEILHNGVRVTITEVGRNVRAADVDAVTARETAKAQATAKRRELIAGERTMTDLQKQTLRDEIAAIEIPPAPRLHVAAALLEWSEPDDAWIVKE